MALARLSGCAGSPEPLLFAYMISTIFSWAGSFGFLGFPYKASREYNTGTVVAIFSGTGSSSASNKVPQRSNQQFDMT